MTIDQVARLLVISGCVAYVACVVATLWGRRRLAVGLFAAGWVLNAGCFACNWIVAQSPPFGNMFHVMTFLPLCLFPLYLYSWRVQKQGWLLGFFSAAAFLPLLGTLFMSHEMTWNRMPALQSPWFVPHVASYILSYSLAAVAFLLIVSSYVAGESERYCEAAYRIMLLAFPFMTFGLFSGALWAEEVWGAYWNWDIKEVWSLITWGCYLIYFHCRYVPEYARWQRVANIMAFCALLVTFLVVNLLPKIESLHSYAS